MPNRYHHRTHQTDGHIRGALRAGGLARRTAHKADTWDGNHHSAPATPIGGPHRISADAPATGTQAALIQKAKQQPTPGSPHIRAHHQLGAAPLTTNAPTHNARAHTASRLACNGHHTPIAMNTQPDPPPAPDRHNNNMTDRCARRDARGANGSRTASTDRPCTPRPRLDFRAIRRHCEFDTMQLPGSTIDPHPQAFAWHRTRKWPHAQPALPSHITEIYEAVRATGLPNIAAARKQVPSDINVAEWEARLTASPDHRQLVDLLRYGFPLGYMGPTTDDADTPNHSSATQHPTAVREFMSREMTCGAVYGPYRAPPFKPWYHVSPLMTREKADPTKRRVIADMSFPAKSSINAYIVKNTALGDTRRHTLPTVDMFTQELRRVGAGAYMFTMDISRAYKNFRSCPLDWPLLGVSWDDRYYLDISVPFGARGSSCHVQRVAEAIVYMLRQQGIKATMYLDDLIVVADGHKKCWTQFKVTRLLFTTLGLPEAIEKTQTPARRVRWLGIDICAATMTLTMPADKLQDTQKLVAATLRKESITKKQLQSLLGKLLHMSKCVQPARIFVGRLLDVLRAMPDSRTAVTGDMRADLAWFRQFACDWNGTSIIPPIEPHRTMEVDACMGGIGGADDTRAYSHRLVINNDRAHQYSINHLEALNIVVALHTFVTEQDKGGHIRVMCDNLAAVQVLTSGRGQDPCLMEAARAAWMLQAVMQVKVSFNHIPGASNVLADALSRAHISPAHANKAITLCVDKKLTPVEPCMLAYSQYQCPSYFRYTASETEGGGRAATDPGQGAGHMGKLQGGGPPIPAALRSVRGARTQPRSDGDPLLDRRAHGPTVPIIRGQQHVAHKDALPPPACVHGASRRRESQASHGRSKTVERPQAKANEGRSDRHNKKGRSHPRRDGQPQGGGLRRNDYVLHGRATIRNSAQVSKNIRPDPAHNTGGHSGMQRAAQAA